VKANRLFPAALVSSSQVFLVQLQFHPLTSPKHSDIVR